MKTRLESCSLVAFFCVKRTRSPSYGHPGLLCMMPPLLSVSSLPLSISPLLSPPSLFPLSVSLPLTGHLARESVRSVSRRQFVSERGFGLGHCTSCSCPPGDSLTLSARERRERGIWAGRSLSSVCLVRECIDRQREVTNGTKEGRRKKLEQSVACLEINLSQRSINVLRPPLESSYILLAVWTLSWRRLHEYMPMSKKLSSACVDTCYDDMARSCWNIRTT